MKLMKLILLGFLIIAVTILIGGGIALNSMITMSNEADEIIFHEMPIKDVSMEAIIALEITRIEVYESLDSQEHIADLEEYLHEFDMYLAMVQYGTKSPEFINSDSGKLYKELGIDIVSEQGTDEMINKIVNVHKIYEEYYSEIMSLTEKNSNFL